MNTNHPPSKNAADAVQVKEASQKDRRRRERELEDVLAILQLAAGRRFFWRYLAGLDTDCAEHSGSWTYHQLGQRKILSLIKQDIREASFEAYQLMEKEAEDRNRKGLPD